MQRIMRRRTHGNHVLLGVISGLSPKFPVTNLKTLQAAAELRSPSVLCRTSRQSCS